MPRISQIAAGAFAAALAFTSVASFAVGSSDPETDQVKSRVVERLGVRPTTVAKTPFGLWEISVAPDQVFYVDGNVRYLLLGNAVDIATRENLTEKRIAEISRVDWKTLPQKDLSAAERLKNLSGAFAAGEIPEGIRSVILVDDIYTTGSTIEACARALRASGISRVYFVVICMTGGR